MAGEAGIRTHLNGWLVHHDEHKGPTKDTTGPRRIPGPVVSYVKFVVPFVMNLPCSRSRKTDRRFPSPPAPLSGTIHP